MKILDEKNNEILNPNLELGYLKEDKILTKYIPYIPKSEGVFSKKLIKTYENGSQEFIEIMEKPVTEEQKEYKEYDNVLRYILYTKGELLERKKKKEEELRFQEEQKKKAQIAREKQAKEKQELLNTIDSLQNKILELEVSMLNQGGNNV